MGILYVPLSQPGKTVVIDEADWPLIKSHRWNEHHGHARRQSRNKTIYMHKVLCPCPDGQEVDHIDQDGLNNRRENLRCVTRSQNQRNTSRRRTTASGHKCVYRVGNRWKVAISVKNKTRSVGYFLTLEEAVAARDAAIEGLH